jgi:hypothetical protein
MDDGVRINLLILCIFYALVLIDWVYFLFKFVIATIDHRSTASCPTENRNIYANIKIIFMKNYMITSADVILHAFFNSKLQ